MIKRRNAGIISSAVLFVLVFISQKSGLAQWDNAAATGAELGLLLFILPGMAGSMLSAEQGVIGPMLGALCATPLCLLMFYLAQSVNYTLWHQLAYLLSAVFWCGFGALSSYFIVRVFKRPLH
ncbi:inner membrane protein YbjM [Biostraticola tofi]|uniref:Putative inner membrane protein YbjM n=1 Tax=Biostraticola tofi TaxID=466109 RepID=A0A4R3YZW0_9GAMM|nr:inner membrane protein YbjM [Biostraticola tofi]TCV98102.1 putative inner membrane protein YbjM [Biostraticola tofi]